MDENILEKSSPDALTDQIIRFLLVNPSSVFFQVTKDFSSGDEKETGFRLSCLKKGKTHDINYYDHEDRDSILHQINVESRSNIIFVYFQAIVFPFLNKFIIKFLRGQ